MLKLKLKLTLLVSSNKFADPFITGVDKHSLYDDFDWD